ncbi:dicarboxylate/amino acid:cation symporter [Legionella sp. W05-934-2]|jgi:Na+/H+-dicarboxylate symporter|uniref:dicarboxylate/amino acid:cation symporter n=1 Tax=Legionella sp. W05-934-2 TaxID=1198649 RepID=UPI0034631F49
MQYTTKLLKTWLQSNLFIYGLMISLGLFVGYYEIYILDPIGHAVADIFVRLFKLISLPIISLSIIVTVSKCQPDGSIKRIWRRMLFYTFTTTAVAALVSFFLYVLIQPQSINTSQIDTQTLTGQAFHYSQYLYDIFPSNFLDPFLNNKVMGAIFLSLIVGFALPQIPDKQARDAVFQFFNGVHKLLMVLTQWLIRLIPLALFGFMTTTIHQLHAGKAMTGLFQYLLVIVGANLIQGLIILPLWLRAKGLKPFIAMKKMMPALSLAFFSKSSVGSLPVTMDTIEKNWGVRTSTSRMLLPLCTSLNMNGCAAFIFTTVMFVMHCQGVDFSLLTMLLWVFIATIAAIGNAGVPMGCFFLSASLLSGMNMSIELMSVILPFYALIDMLETALNVWSDACVTKVVDHGIDAQKVDLGLDEAIPLAAQRASV